MTRTIRIATPMHGYPVAHHSICMGHFLVEASKRFNLQYDPPLNVSNLAERRCLMLAEAIEEGADKLLFIDDDIVFRPEDAFRLLSTEKPVVSGMYRKKLEEVVHVGYKLEDAGLPPAVDGPLVGMAAVGMGFCVIDLGFVREKMIPRVEKGCVKTFSKEGMSKIPAWFEFRVDRDLSGEERFMGEDEIFCKHVIESGLKKYGFGSVWIHTGVVVGHVGPYVYK